MYNESDILKLLDFGDSVPTGIKMEKIVVKVSAEGLMEDFCKAFINEAARKMPLTAQQPNALTLPELIDYCRYLLKQRILVVQLNCKDWRKLKALYIPSFIQYLLDCVGEVVLHEYGIRFVPELDGECDLTFDQAAIISDKISAYLPKLQIIRDGMPRKVSGDPDVMSTVIIADYVRSFRLVAHPQSTYLSALLNAKLANEAAFAALFRVQYDDMEFIRSAIVANGGRLV